MTNNKNYLFILLKIPYLKFRAKIWKAIILFFFFWCLCLLLCQEPGVFFHLFFTPHAVFLAHWFKNCLFFSSSSQSGNFHPFMFEIYMTSLLLCLLDKICKHNNKLTILSENKCLDQTFSAAKSALCFNGWKWIITSNHKRPQLLEG